MRANNMDFYNVGAFNERHRELVEANSGHADDWNAESDTVRNLPYDVYEAMINPGEPFNQDSDYRSSLYYYDPSRHLAFHWTGNPSHQVEVSYGGDHESPMWAFSFEDHRPKDLEVGLGIHNVVIAFQAACMDWIDAKETAR